MECVGAFGDSVGDGVVYEELRNWLVLLVLGPVVLIWDFVSQASKCTRWMPRHRPAKKDVASCEKLRGAASEHRSGDI